MTGRHFNFHDGEKGAALAIRVKLSRSKSKFVKVLKDETVVIQLRQEDGDINAQLIGFISKELKVPKNRIQVIAGEDGNKKLISVVDMTPGQAQKMILELIP